MSTLNLNLFNRLKYWVQLALPLVYDDSLSYMELLGKIVDAVNELGDNYNTVRDIVIDAGADFEMMKEDITIIENELESIKNGKYLGVYIEALKEWIDKNLQELVGKIVTFVFFGLTDDGYFVAYIPESWDDITFRTTGLDTMLDYDYGHLVLKY